MAKKVGGPVPKKKQTKQTNGGGTLIISSNGRLVRTKPMAPYVSIDTTGYGKGKKEFDLQTSYSGAKPITKKIQRKDVPETINKLKKGATRTEDYRVKTKTKK